MFDFSGRTARAPFWIAFILFFIALQFSLASEIWAVDWDLGQYKAEIIFGFKALSYLFIFLLASLFVRRLHDVGMSLWDALNPFAFKHYFTTFWDAGEAGHNRFGPPHVLMSDDR